MSHEEIVSYLAAEIEPLRDNIYGGLYRTSAYLTDGAYLPCVVFQSKEKRVDLAVRRFAELKKEPKEYRDVVGSFVAGASSVASYDVLRIEPSPFALPLAVLKQIHGETTMGWTAFVAEMKDGHRFSYGTRFSTEFFEIPAGYSVTEIKEIHSGMIHSEADGTQPFTFDRHKRTQYLRERPFFRCYLDAIGA